MHLIREMVQISGNKIVCFSDPPSLNTNKLLLYCCTIASDINRMIRRYYGWDCQNIQRGYKMIEQQIMREKKEI